MYIKRKSAALLITLLIVSSIGLLAIVSLRSTILGLAANTRIADNIVAEEASRGGLEYGLTKCQSAATSPLQFFVNMENNFVQADPITFAANSRYADVYITYAPAGADRLCNIWSIGHIGNTYKKHQVSTVVKLTSGTGTGTARLYLGDQDQGNFFLSSTYQLGNFEWLANHCTNTRAYVTVDDNGVLNDHLREEACAGEWDPNGFITGPLRNPAPSVRIFKDNGDLVGYLHVLREDTGGSLSWDGIGSMLVDEGRFMDSTVNPQAYDDVNMAYALSWVEWSYHNEQMRGYGKWIKTADLPTTPRDKGLNDTLAQAQRDYLQRISDLKLHFLVVDEAYEQIVGELVAYDDSGELGKFQGAAFSTETGFWGGAPDGTFFISLSGSLVGNYSCSSWNDIWKCPRDFMTNHSEFKYKLKP